MRYMRPPFESLFFSVFAAWPYPKALAFSDGRQTYSARCDSVHRGSGQTLERRIPALADACSHSWDVSCFYGFDDGAGCNALGFSVCNLFLATEGLEG